MAISLVPSDATPLGVLLSRLATKLPNYATALGVTPAELTQLSADSAMLTYLAHLADAARTFSPSVTAYRDTLISGAEQAVGPIPVFAAPVSPPATVPGGIIPRTRRLLQKVRASASYTEAIAADLGLPTGTETASPTPAPTIRPEVTGTHAVFLPGVGVSIPWVKAGHSGVRVTGQRGAESALWESLGDDLYSPFIDKRPSLTPGQPETRRYRFQYKDGDEVIGQLSDIIVVTVPG
jgi:hypothetical protein